MQKLYYYNPDDKISDEFLYIPGCVMDIDMLPDTCPYCHFSMVPEQLTGSINPDVSFGIIDAVFKCTKNDCKKLFIVRYKAKSYNSKTYWYDRVLTGSTEKRTFESLITDTSSLFIKIYNQAQEAEDRGLDQIAGIGYRKALEFLIKDYLISTSKENEEKIKKMGLGQCISDYIKDSNLRAVSRRGTWLGNDEAHYLRKWKNKDVNDLKIAIDLTVYWISSEIKTKKLINEMPENY